MEWVEQILSTSFVEYLSCTWDGSWIGVVGQLDNTTLDDVHVF